MIFEYTQYIITRLMKSMTIVANPVLFYVFYAFLADGILKYCSHENACAG